MEWTDTERLDIIRRISVNMFKSHSSGPKYRPLVTHPDNVLAIIHIANMPTGFLNNNIDSIEAALGEKIGETP